MGDLELEKVAAELHALDPAGARMGRVIRATFDQLYNGQHTGRYRWDQLHKTEKTHCGTLIEINLHREFGFADGVAMDYGIAGVDVDCKYSQTVGGWMIPPESMGHLCLLVSASDDRARFSAGVVRIENAILTEGGNRDAKRSITSAGRAHIRWLANEATLPPNILLELPRADVDRIMSLSSGQQRINEIFRVAPNRRIGRGVIATLGQQDDYMKRVRGNGGSRSRLKREGVVILGHYEAHREIAEQLGAAIPGDGEFVSVRLAPSTGRQSGSVHIGGAMWRLARDSDPIVVAPDCPHC